MQKTTVIRGLLLAIGMLSAGCGGTEAQWEDATQGMGQSQEALQPTCAPGYTEYQTWMCESGTVCQYNGNVLHAWCYSATDSYDAGIITYNCGEPCY